ncbi:MAG TPA: hypothetical protein VFV99_00350 [Kofleriaceae bacterium]|nr:hypothetical protein [Kofleriaceae bacterium]
MAAAANVNLSSWRVHGAVMAALVLAVCIVTILVGERIGVNGGQGWDGIGYTQWAQDFDTNVLHTGLTKYHTQRILPSATVYYALRALGVTRTVPHVISAFLVLNTLLLTLGAVIWAHLGEVMKWPRAAVWAGFIALFGSFANLRHALYYPTLTDPTAFVMGLAMTWAYLTKRPVVLGLVALLSTVTWPALPPIAIALLVLPRADAMIDPETRWQRVQRLVALSAALALAGVFLWTARIYLLHPVPGVGDEKFAAWVRRDLLVLTVPGLIIMLGGGWYLLLRQGQLWNPTGYVRQLRVRRTLIAIAAAGAIVALRAVWITKTGTHGEGPTWAQFKCEHTLAAIRGPLWGIVHHVVYFGPIILVATIAWRRIAALGASWGPSAVLALALALAFAAGSNSRQWNHLVPFIVAATIAVTHELWTTRRVVEFAALTLAWSKLWLVIGYDKHDNWLTFPNQRYFMNQGPYANDTMYLVHLIACAVTTGLLYVLLFRSQSAVQAHGGAVGGHEP